MNIPKYTLICLLPFLLCVLSTLSSCNESTVADNGTAPPQSESSIETQPTAEMAEKELVPERWKELTADDGFILDIRYATTDNFTGKQIYECGRCFLHPEVAGRLLQLQADIQRRYGMRLKLFDCYRPRPAQQRLWDVVPDARYVTPPSKGSMHNRGLAVDLTLVNSEGQELNMGTRYDFFGPEAHVDYAGHSPEVERNRAALRKMMEIHGLKGIRTEWWHFSLKTVKASFDDWEWPCIDT